MKKKLFKKLKLMSISGKLGIIIIILVILIALLSNIIKIYPHNIPSGNSLEKPSTIHFLGTDDLGIDIWAQICVGARISVTIGLSTAFIASFGGSLLGMMAGYYGKTIDKMITGLSDLMMAIPQLPMLIVLGTLFEPKLSNIVIVISLFSWVVPAKIVRSKILSMKEEKYIVIAKSYRAGFFHLVFKHFIPSIFPIIMVSFVKITSRAVISEASLAFLGLGDPISKSWGMILKRSINFPGIYFTEYWKWWVVSPLLLLTLFTISIAFISRDLEKIINTKL